MMAQQLKFSIVSFDKLNLSAYKDIMYSLARWKVSSLSRSEDTLISLMYRCQRSHQIGKLDIMVFCSSFLSWTYSQWDLEIVSIYALSFPQQYNMWNGYYHTDGHICIITTIVAFFYWSWIWLWITGNTNMIDRALLVKNNLHCAQRIQY